MVINTFGDSRRIILETIVALKDGSMPIERGMAIAANMKVLNDNINAEVNVAKLSIAADRAGRDFGTVMRLGTKPIFEGQLLEQE